MSIYIDNLHKQLYVSEASTVNPVSPASRTTLSFGLSDYGELPGQSTWYIRSIRFYCMGYQDLLSGAPYTEFHVQAGIVSRDLAPGGFDDLDDYQDVAGWPLNKVQKDFMLYNQVQQNWFSYQHTYRPSLNLTLNREQNIIWNLKNDTGSNMAVTMGVYLHAQRGD